MKAFECKGCSTIIFIKSSENDPLWCPICRTSMTQIKIKIKEKLKKYKCSECGYEFFINESLNPYKCANCNYTFVTTKGKHQQERL